LGLNDSSFAPSFHRLDPLRGEEWDRIVSEHPGVTVFHTSLWAKVLSETYGFIPRYYVRRGKHDRVEAFCLMEIRSWLTGRRAVSLPFTDRCEPLLYDSGFQSVVEIAREFGRAEKLKKIEFRGLPGTFVPDAPADFLEHSLELSPGPQTLFENFESSVRRAIRKAEKSGVQVTIERGIDAVQEYFSLHCITRHKHGVPPPPFKFFENTYRHLINAGFGFVALARSGGNTLAGAVFFHFRGKAEYKFGASSGELESVRPSNAVMWAGIQQLAGEGCQTLGFGRTSIGNEGLRRYKLGWGTKETELRYLKICPLSGEYLSSSDLAEGFHTRLLRKLPAGLFRRVGSVLYRHIG
jgi:hypothetical protein